MKEWFKAAGIRAIKTIAQTAIATIGTAAVLGDVNWVMVASAAALAGVLSLLTSVAGLPEMNNEGGIKYDVTRYRCTDEQCGLQGTFQGRILSISQ